MLPRLLLSQTLWDIKALLFGGCDATKVDFQPEVDVEPFKHMWV